MRFNSLILYSIISINHLINNNLKLLCPPRQAGDNRREAKPFVLMKHASLRQVAGRRIVTQDAGDLRESTVVSRGVMHHMAR